MKLIASGKGSRINRVENEIILEGIVADYGHR